MKGESLHQLVSSVIARASSIGLQIVTVTSDMGPSNQAMWKVFGIQSKQDYLTSFVMHPTAPTNRLHFLADVPHILKNLCSAFLSHKVFTLDKETCRDNNLISNKVCVCHLITLAKFQSTKALKIAPKLQLEAFQSTSHFRKMNVSHAVHIFSKPASAGLRYLVQQEGHSEDLLTTAWYVDMVASWFNLMSSRHPVNALSEKNIGVYRSSRSLLSTFVEVTRKIEIGERKPGSHCKPPWKPVQAGIILSTKSVLNLCDDLLGEKLDFLLTGRLTQDCVENPFSVVRSRKPIPSAREFKYALKLICVAQYLKPVRGSNYEQDDREFLGDLLPDEIVPPAVEPDLDDTDITITIDELLNPNEEQSLYYLAGYCVQSLKKLSQLCDKCLRPLKHVGDDAHPQSALLQLKNFKAGALFEVCNSVYKLFYEWEILIRSFLRSQEGNTKTPNLGKILTNRCMRVAVSEHLGSPSCHPVGERLAGKFVTVRLHIFCSTIDCTQQQPAVPHGSRSMAMRALVKKV